MIYKKKTGNTRVPNKFPENLALGHWVSAQRSTYEKDPKGNTSCLITKERIRLLNQICFEWKIQECVLWNHRYNELVSYVKEFGDT